MGRITTPDGVSDRFLSRLRAAWQRWTDERPRVLIGVSGGPDSVALLIGLAALREERNLELFAAHVHHGWRGIEADADAAFVSDLGRRLSVPTHVLAITPELKSHHAAKSLEEGARNARYALLTECAAQHSCPLVAVGHTADDQVETVLHHILRGTGLAGLGGMPEERCLADAIRLVRPLLGLRRADVLAYLAEQKQPYRIDATNADASLTRNRLRLELLPLLRERFNPQVDAALLRLARQAEEASAIMEHLANNLLAESLLSEAEFECRLDARRLAQEPEPLVRQTLRRLWIRRNWPRQEMGQAEWRKLAALVYRPGTVDFPQGISARHDDGPLVIGRRGS